MNKDWRETLDHPLVFLVVVTLGVMAMSSLFTAGAKATGLFGVASLSQHP
jgi:membrane-bound ClpP family serine protease